MTTVPALHPPTPEAPPQSQKNQASMQSQSIGLARIKRGHGSHFRNLLVPFACLLLLFAFTASATEKEYPSDIAGAKITKKWSDDGTSCKVTVELQNVTPDILVPVPASASGIDYSMFPEILETAILTDPGKPELPYVVVGVEIPYDIETSVFLDSVETVEGGDWSEIAIAPATAPWPEMREAQRPPLAENPSIYQLNDFFPYGNLVVLGERTEVRGYKYQNLLFFPVKYNPVLRRVRLQRIEATLFLGSGEKISEIERTKSADAQNALYSSSYAQSYSTLIDSFEPPNSEDLPTIEGRAKGCDYLVITPNSLKDALKPLITLKDKRHLAVKVVTFQDLKITDEDDADSRRTKIADRVKAEFKYERKPAYLLLVGDAGAIPPFLKTRHTYYNHYIATDMFYGMLEDNKWIPDLSIGRLPARNADELKIMVKKITDYEATLDANLDKPKWGRALIVGEYENKVAFVRNEMKTRTYRWFHQTAYNVGRWLRHSGESPVESVDQVYVALDPSLEKPWYNFDGSVIPQDVMSCFLPGNAEALAAIQHSWVDNTRFVLHRDHGWRGGWGYPAFTARDVQNLAQPSVSPVVLSLNCETGWYDDESNSCFALDLMRHPNGASAVIAASRVSWSRYNDRFTEGLIKSAWNDFVFDFTMPEVEENKRIGAMLTDAKAYLIKRYPDETSRMTVQLFNLFGDPEMRLVTGSRMADTSPASPQPAIGPVTLPPTVSPMIPREVVVFPKSFKDRYE